MASNLEEINEANSSHNDSIGLSGDEEEGEEEEDEESNKIILELREKVLRLEKMNSDLKEKINDLKKNKIENDSIMRKLTSVGNRRKIDIRSGSGNIQNNLKMAELIKEKDDLQEMNEKMLDLLTEKEIENEDLQQKFDNYKLEVKMENDKNLEKIQNLENKIELLENSKDGTTTMIDIDEIIKEYDKSKDKYKQQINELTKSEEELKSKLDLKERSIEKLNESIRKLELEKFKLVRANTTKEKIKEKEGFEIEKLKTEIDKYKREISILEDKLQVEKENSEKLAAAHKEEMENHQKKLEAEENNAKTMKEEQLKEINSLKVEITKISKDLDTYTKKAEVAEKRLDDEKQKNFMIQNKLDKKGKELQEMNEYTKKLLKNKDNLLTQYEKKIEEITKDKNDLLSQNKILLEKIKKKESGEINPENKEEGKEEEKNENEEKGKDIQQYIHENKILSEEVKSLKSQLEDRVKDLIELDTYEKELVRLRAQNDTLIKDNKEMKDKLIQMKKKEESEEVEVGFKRQRSKGITYKNSSNNNVRKTVTLRYNNKNNLNALNFQKQLNALKKIKEEEQKNYEERINKNQIEMARLKVKTLNLEYKYDELNVKYKNLVKAITEECNKKGIKLCLYIN